MQLPLTFLFLKGTFNTTPMFVDDSDYTAKSVASKIA